MKKHLSGFLSLLFSLAIANAQYNQPIVIPGSTTGGQPTIGIQNLAGICAVVRKEKDTGRIAIVEVIPDGAAAKAGLLAMDRIEKIDGKTLEGMDLPAVVTLLRGDPGTQVQLSIARDDQPAPFDVIVTRELVRLKEVPPPK